MRSISIAMQVMVESTASSKRPRKMVVQRKLKRATTNIGPKYELTSLESWVTYFMIRNKEAQLSKVITILPLRMNKVARELAK